MNIFEKARKGEIPHEIAQVAQSEGLSADYILQNFISGEIVIMKNSLRSIAPLAVGKGLKTKVNANIGTSPDLFDLDTELSKLTAAIEAGADAVMDLSTGGDIAMFRNRILEQSPLALGTVPLYEVAVDMIQKKQSLMDMTIDDFLKVIRRQAEDGVDFMTIHSGVTRESIRSLHSQKRIIGITSRGGSIIAEWMLINKKENPLYEHYDEILDILRQYNVVISLGDGIRPGALNDASDRGQVHEMIILGDLARRARERGVQAIIEGPGHVPMDMIADNMRLQKSICDGAPYYVLGPLVTDVAPGYDHITGAIGGAIAAMSGADFLCYVTPAEHLRLPDPEDVREGVIASRIAAHAADIVKLGDRAKKWDNDMSRARKNRDWESMYRLALDEKKARRYRSQIPSGKDDQCSMCGEFCAIKRKY
ncbi:MAG TPA: phosphomethylpyrimidine synthase ThiC [Spirochaetota bacterium]|nr:phosphomethylpyrimidine synthase ThiC [Spirochaetota bacterium]HPR49290.1 phosphomethylpyrimidine synthase ThiC [Spirochaetota bacterium]